MWEIEVKIIWEGFNLKQYFTEARLIHLVLRVSTGCLSRNGSEAYFNNSIKYNDSVWKPEVWGKIRSLRCFRCLITKIN